MDFARPGRVAGEGAKQKKQHTEEVLALAAAPATAGVEFYAQILVITPDQPIVKGQQVSWLCSWLRSQLCSWL